MKNNKRDVCIIVCLILFSLFLFYKSGCLTEAYIGIGFACLAFSIMMYFMYKKLINEKDKRQTIVVTAIIVILMLLIPTFALFLKPQYQLNADGFTIEEYEVILDVGIDNKVEVTENIKVNFYESGHHGIYKFTPEWLEYTGKDGKTIKRKSEVLNYRAIGQTYTIEKGKKPKIKIGDKNYTVYGLNSYEIKYTYDMGSDPYDNFDAFIFHAFGDYWGTEIKNPKITINMPKDIGYGDINVFTDKYRKNNVNNLVNIERYGNSIIISNKDLKLMNALTIDIELPDNYFVEGINNYGMLSYLATMVIIGVTGYIFFMWSKYGKDDKTEIPTIEFYAPDNLNSAEIGYVYNNGKANQKLTISLIIQLASKGYIKIDEIKGKNKRDNKIEITNLYAGQMINNITHLDEMEKIVYDKLFESSNKVILKEHSTFYETFQSINEILESKFNDKVYNPESQNKKAISIIIASILLFLSLISFFCVEDLNPKMRYLYFVAFGFVIIDYIFAFIMIKRTKYGEIVKARVKGFREFLVTAEKEKLESLVEKNPQYFYDILPYTYVLNISKKWIEKFQNIKMPETNMGNFDYSSGDIAFSSLLNNVSYPSSSVSGGGGGCSSCGGGCSSCGGGGSW